MAIVGKKSIGERIFKIFNIFFLVFVIVIMMYPFINMAAISLSSRIPVIRGEVTFFPKKLTFDAYIEVLTSPDIFRAYYNTIFVVIVGTFVSVIATAFMSYSLSKKYLVGRTWITFFIAFTMWFSGGMIPTFLLVVNIGLYNSLWALILVPLIQPFNIIIMRNFFQSIPESLEESARIDGCNDLRVLFQIVMPLSKPILATISLWIAVAHWNQFMNALLYIKDKKLFPLQIVLRDILLAHQTSFHDGTYYDEAEFVPESIKYATIMVSTIPIIMVYPFLQKHFVKGVLVGSIKG